MKEIFILVPALLGLKGNLEMTLASRLSTQVSVLPQSAVSRHHNVATLTSSNLSYSLYHIAILFTHPPCNTLFDLRLCHLSLLSHYLLPYNMKPLYISPFCLSINMCIHTTTLRSQLLRQLYLLANGKNVLN